MISWSYSSPLSLSHLTSLTPTKSNLHLGDSLETAVSDPYIPSTKSHAPFPLFRSYQSNSLGLRHMYRFRNKADFYGEELLAPRPTPKLEVHPLSAVRDCLFNIFAATLHIVGRSSLRNLRTCHAVVTGTHLRFSTSFGVKNTRPTVLYLLLAAHARTQYVRYLLCRLHTVGSPAPLSAQINL